MTNEEFATYLKGMADARRNKQRVILFVILGLFMLFIIIAGLNGTIQKTEKPEDHRSAKELREEKITSLFSPYDGSHHTLTRYLKNNLHDPDSYEHVETRYIEVADSILVVTTRYRAKNGFGAMRLGTIVAESDLDGNIKVISQGQ